MLSKYDFATAGLILAVAGSALAQAGADPAIAFGASYVVMQGSGNNRVTTTFTELTVMNQDGSNRKVLLTRGVNSTSTTALSDPSWSPDLDGNPLNGYRGCLLVGINDSPTNEFQTNLYVMDVSVVGGVPQASNLRLIVDATVDPNVGTAIFDPEWSPDLDPTTAGYQGKIVFIGSTDGGNSGSVNLVDMQWDGTTAQLVGPPSSSTVLYDGHPLDEMPFHPTWSPDGARIAVTLVGNSTIVLLDAGNGATLNTINLSPFGPRNLQWSRNSSRIVFQDSYASGRPIYTMDVDLGSSSLVLVPVASSAGRMHPAWSPSDTELVFANLSTARKAKWDIVRRSFATGAVTVLVNGQAIGRDLRLSDPDWRRF